jgi:hypothetical protein
VAVVLGTVELKAVTV